MQEKQQSTYSLGVTFNMEETVTPPTSLKLDNLWSDKINGVDIFEYIRERLEILKEELESFIEAEHSKQHLHTIADVQGLPKELIDIKNN